MRPQTALTKNTESSVCQQQKVNSKREERGSRHAYIKRRGEQGATNEKVEIEIGGVGKQAREKWV